MVFVITIFSRRKDRSRIPNGLCLVKFTSIMFTRSFAWRYNYLSVLRILLKCLNSAVELFLFAFCDEASFPALLTRHLLGPNVLVQQNSTIFACIAVRWTSYARVNWLTVFREHWLVCEAVRCFMILLAKMDTTACWRPWHAGCNCTLDLLTYVWRQMPGGRKWHDGCHHSLRVTRRGTLLQFSLLC